MKRNVCFALVLRLTWVAAISRFREQPETNGVTAKATSLHMVITPQRTWQILLATVAMCVLSGAIALRKIKSADPADIF